MESPKKMHFLSKALLLATWLLLLNSSQQSFSQETRSKDDETAKYLPSIAERFKPQAAELPPVGDEIPSFQKHVSPLMGRLGCNGRACHGSFQGRGDFRLSLFGFDFDADHESLLQENRVDREKPLESLVLTKPVDADMHEGGKRFDKGGWEYWVLRRWIEARAPFEKGKFEKISRLEVVPSEITFAQAGQKLQLKITAHWQNGQSEDVTCLCRFQTNDPAVATIDQRGLVTAGEKGDTHVVVSYDSAVVPVEVLRPYSDLTGQSIAGLSQAAVDQRVNAKLHKAGIMPSKLCTDQEFLRRASLDVTGTLPTAAEVTAFATDTNPDKRSQKIEELLQRPGYAAQWATFLCDMTGNNDDQLRNFLPVRQGELPSIQWYAWIRQRLADNVPYDELVEGIVTAKSRLPDESYGEYCEAMSNICQDETGEQFAKRPGLVHYWVRNNFKTPEEKAIGFAYSFLGVRIQCAQCHKHPFDQWTKADFDSFERLFVGIQGNQNTMASDAKKQANAMIDSLGIDKSLKGNQLRKELALKLEAGSTIPFPELMVTSRGQEFAKEKDKAKRKEMASKAPQAKLLGSDSISLDQEDIRGKLMDWLRSPENPYFAKAFVNRVWTHYFSVGIVNPSDDLSLANAPSNAPLLDYLANGFIEHKFDMKWLHREILTSQTYQRSWETNDSNRLDKRNFSHAHLRRIPAEAAYDAVWMALADDSHASEAATFGRSRALTVAGASPQVRNGDTNYALSVFGRSVRETNCDCDRTNDPSLLQTVFLLNDAAVQNWLSDPNQGWAASIAKQYGWPIHSRAGKENANSANVDSANANKMSKEQNRERMANMQANFEKQLSKIADRLKQASESGDSQLIGQLKRRQSAIEEQLKRTSKFAQTSEAAKIPSSQADGAPSSSQDSSSLMSSEQARTITEQAYVRALSRLPTEDEKHVAVNFLCSEHNRVAAVESLIWSIVNTKEFILNH